MSYYCDNCKSEVTSQHRCHNAKPSASVPAASPEMIEAEFCQDQVDEALASLTAQNGGTNEG